MTQAQQPEALRLAEQCDNFDTRAPIAACLRAQHARIQELEMNLVHRLEVYTASLEQIVCLQDRIQELEQGKCLLQIAEPAAQGLDAQDASRWREAIKKVGAENQLGAARYVIRGLEAPRNVMRGCVAGHFTKSIDAAIATQTKQGGAA